MKYSRVLTIAGSDSGGGAGIQADIKAMSACGCFAMSAITAITSQNTLGVTGVYPVACEAIEAQIDAVVSDIGVDAVKIGMLSTSEVMMSVKRMLSKYDIKNVVLDPVMVSTSGHKLMQDDAIETLKTELIGMSRIITPNIMEAEILLGKTIQRQGDLSHLAKEMADKYDVSVLLKAGHLEDDDLIDVFYNNETSDLLQLKSKRQYTQNTHGTGCTLSSAIAAFLSKGMSMNEAVKHGKEYIRQAIEHGRDYEIGGGHGPVHHFWNYWS